MGAAVLSLIGAVLTLSISQLCSAEKVDSFRETRSLLNHFPDSMPREIREHTLQSMHWRYNERQSEFAQKVSKIYRDKGIFTKALVGGSQRISGACLGQLNAFIADLGAGKAYARYMEDSYGRRPSGLLRGDYLWLGKFYECQGQTNKNGLLARMCVVVLSADNSSVTGLHLGTCFPDDCQEDDVANWMELIFNGTYATVFCAEDKGYSDADIAAIFVFSILGFFVFLGTALDAVFICLDLYYKVSSYLLLCFSLIKNTRALLNTERKESTIAVLDGIRFFSMAWVILGHTLFFVIGTISNFHDLMDYYPKHFGAQVVVNGTFSVDSFFFLSGLLVTYLTLREFRRSKVLNIPVMYLHRYLRLTPTLAIVILFSSTIFMRAAEEPIFEMRNTGNAEACKEYWWTIVLYINNLYPWNGQCIPWVWYLANDWQFFLLSPLFVYLLYRHTRIGLVTLAVVITASITVTGVLSSHYSVYPDVLYWSVFSRVFPYLFGPNSPPPDFNISDTAIPLASNDAMESDYFSDIYSKPWCRIGVYLIGMWAGYVLFKTNKKFKMRLIHVIGLWIAAFTVGLSVIYGWWGDVEVLDLNSFPSNDLAAFYEAMKRPTWALCLTWLTIACSIGYGGPINAILSWEAFIPLSRLTFCAYLVHPLVLRYMYTAREIEPHFRVNIFVYYFVAALVLSYAAAYVLSMLIEAPMNGLQKIIFYAPEGKKPWYSIFGINLARSAEFAQFDAAKSVNGYCKRMNKDEGSESSARHQKMSFVNCVDTKDEVENEKQITEL